MAHLRVSLRLSGLVARTVNGISCTLRGATVLDVFGGSGTTLIACEKAERKGRLIRLRSDDFDSGITTGVFNSRGVYMKDPMAGGEQTRAIAARYNGYADAIAGTHPRASRVSRTIADNYVRFATREDDEAQQRDLD